MTTEARTCQRSTEEQPQCVLQAMEGSEFCLWHQQEGPPKSWKVEVIADSSGKWAGNGLYFKTFDKAADWGDGLSQRWTSVRDVRVVPDWEHEANR